MKRVFILSLLHVAALASVINNGDNIAIVDKSGVRTVPFEQMTEAQRKDAGMTAESVAKVRLERKQAKERAQAEAEKKKADAAKLEALQKSAICVVGSVINSDNAGALMTVEYAEPVLISEAKERRDIAKVRVLEKSYDGPGLPRASCIGRYGDKTPGEVIYVHGVDRVDGSGFSGFIIPDGTHAYTAATGAAKRVRGYRVVSREALGFSAQAK